MFTYIRDIRRNF